MKENKDEIKTLIDKAVSGDKQALETLLSGIQDTVFNLSLRMLGTPADAEDASQEILIRIMTNLASFKGESKFSTWVYRISVNFLLNYKKSMFAKYPLNFEYYGDDISSFKSDQTEDVFDTEERKTFAKELRLSCTNVMLQCLDAESRCIFIFGTMFKLDSHVAAEILNMTPENYRKKLSRIRKKFAGFLSYYCGLTETGLCSCDKRVCYAISQKRLDPANLEYSKLNTKTKALLSDYTNEMERLDALSQTFEQLPEYKSPVSSKTIITTLLNSSSFKKIMGFKEEI